MDAELNRIDRVGRLQNIEPEPEPLLARQRERLRSRFHRDVARGGQVTNIDRMIGDRMIKVKAGETIQKAVRRRVREPFIQYDDEYVNIPLKTAIREAKLDSGGSLIGADGRPTIPAKNLKRAIRQGVTNRFGRPL